MLDIYVIDQETEGKICCCQRRSCSHCNAEPVKENANDWFGEIAGDLLDMCMEALLKNVRVLCNEEKKTTTVVWGDGSSTRVRAAEGEKMDAYHAFTAAVAKRVIGSNSKVSALAASTEKFQRKTKKKKKAEEKPAQPPVKAETKPAAQASASAAKPVPAAAPSAPPAKTAEKGTPAASAPATWQPASAASKAAAASGAAASVSQVVSTAAKAAEEKAKVRLYNPVMGEKMGPALRPLD